MKKCRYYNRGFCKFSDKCIFVHPLEACNDYLEDGICRKEKCAQRHPRHCRYWTKHQEGCKRENLCQYLHAESKKFGSQVCVEEVDEPEKPSENTNCELTFENDDGLQNHDSRYNRVDKLFNCEECIFTCDNNNDLSLHQDTNHGSLHPEDTTISKPDAKTPCNHCKFVAKSQRGLNRHIIMNQHNEYQYPCDQCEHKSSTEYELTTHVQTDHVYTQNESLEDDEAEPSMLTFDFPIYFPTTPQYRT